MRKPFYECEIPSDFQAMMDLINAGILALRKRGWIDEGREPATRLCLEEALVNAIRHGNQSDARRKVRLVMEEECDGCCRIKVEDEGCGFQPETIAEPATDQLGGRGLCLIRHFMDKVTYNRDRRCLEMCLSRPGSEGARE